jgi:hypothetical protein
MGADSGPTRLIHQIVDEMQHRNQAEARRAAGSTSQRVGRCTTAGGKEYPNVGLDEDGLHAVGAGRKAQGPTQVQIGR